MRRNIFLFNFMNFFHGLWLFSAMAVIYFEQVCQSYALAMLAFSLVNIFQCIMEIPCGMVSDRLSRKNNLFLGEVCLFVNMALWALAGYFGSVGLLFAGSCLRGIGLALMSGTDTAMIYETLAQIRKRKLFMVVLAKIRSFHQLGLLTAALTATIVTYYFSLKVLVWLSVIPAFLNVFAVALMKNPKNQFNEEMSLQKQLVKSFMLFFKKKKLRNYAMLSILNVSVTNSIFRFEAAYFGQLLPMYMISIVRILQHLMGCISFRLAAMISKMNLLKIICYSTVGNAFFRLLGLLMNNPISPFVIAMQNIFYGPASASSTALLQREYSNNLRATMDSMMELVGGLFIALFSFLFGMAADFYSPRTILFGGVVLCFVIALAYHRLWKPIVPKEKNRLSNKKNTLL